MKRMPSTTSLWLACLLSSLPITRADTIYLSTYNLNTVLDFDSIGNQSTFATASSGLDYPLGLAFDGSGNLYVANSGGDSRRSAPALARVHTGSDWSVARRSHW